MTAAKVQLLGALTTVSHRHGRQSTTLVAWASLGAPLGVGGANCSSHDSDFLRSFLHTYHKMPAINNALVAREAISHITKRENWAQQEAGVVVVFCIVFVVAVGIIGLVISKKISAARAKKQALSG
ncbi:hypothetical protein LA080_009214 [Diaporthe eres]|nr:hypothetical protein LA080_009214 [Diaporthe eres]